MSIDEIIEKQGWNESTVNDLLFRYIENQGSMDALSDFLERAAQEENEESDTTSSPYRGIPAAQEYRRYAAKVESACNDERHEEPCPQPCEACDEECTQTIYVLSFAPSYDRGNGGGCEWRRTWEEMHELLRDPEWMEPSSDYRVVTLELPRWLTDADITDFLGSAYGTELVDPPDPRTDLNELLAVWDINRKSALPGEEVYVLHIGADVNFEIGGVFKNGEAAESAALATVQGMWDAMATSDIEIPRPEKYADVEKWNEYWDGEAKYLVTLHVQKLES